MIATVGGTGSRTVDSQSSAVACNATTSAVEAAAIRPGLGSQLVLGDVTVAVFGTMPSASMASCRERVGGQRDDVERDVVTGGERRGRHVTTWAGGAVQPLGATRRT